MRQCGNEISRIYSEDDSRLTYDISIKMASIACMWGKIFRRIFFKNWRRGLYQIWQRYYISQEHGNISKLIFQLWSLYQCHNKIHFQTVSPQNARPIPTKFHLRQCGKKFDCSLLTKMADMPICVKRVLQKFFSGTSVFCENKPFLFLSPWGFGILLILWEPL